MKKGLLFGLMGMFLGMASMPSLTLLAGQHRAGKEAVRNPFVGAWRLVWLEEPGAGGRVHRVDCAGLLVFTRDGHISVQVMYRNPQAASAGPVQYAQGGYEASYGTYKIDERTHTFYYHVGGALVRSLVGKDFTRIFEFSGKLLIAKSPDPNEHWRVAWEHY